MRASERGNLPVPAGRGVVLCTALVMAGLAGGAVTRAGQGPAPPQDQRAAASSRLAELANYPMFPRVNVATGYEVDATWPERCSGCEWGEMSGLCVDAQDQVWTFNRNDPPVQVYRADGTLVRAWGTGQVGKAHHIRIDPRGNVWLTDIGLHVVRQFTPEGVLLRTLGTPGEPGADSTHLNMPTDVAVTADGQAFVADGYGNNRIVHFDAEGRFLKSWGTMGTGPGEFSLPHAIALDSRGRLYVADRNNVRVQIFNQAGQYLDEWRDLLVPWHVWITPRDEVYVCGSSPMRWGSKLPLPGLMVGIPPKDQLVLKLTPEGRTGGIWSFPLGNAGRERPGELNWVHAVAVDSTGSLYLGDIKGKRAQKFQRLGTEASGGELADRPRRDPAVQPAVLKP